MFTIIDSLRTKPESTKRYIAFAVAFLFVGIIFSIWLSVVYPDIQKVSRQKEAVTKKEPSPFDILSAQVSSVFSDTNPLPVESVESVPTE